MFKAYLPNRKLSRDALREADSDARFLLFFLNDGQVDSCATMDVFSCEIATIPYAVSSSPMGLIRLQWWRDEIAKLYDNSNKVSAMPLLNDLKIAIDNYQIPFAFFDNILSAYEFEINGYGDGESEADRYKAFLDYMDLTHTRLFLRKARIAGERDEEKILLLAKSYTLIRILKSVAFAAARGKALLPDLSVSNIRPQNAAMRDSIRKWINEAEKLLADSMQVQTRYLRAHAALVRLYCAAWKAAEYDPFRLAPIPFKELRVWWHSR